MRLYFGYCWQVIAYSYSKQCRCKMCYAVLWCFILFCFSQVTVKLTVKFEMCVFDVCQADNSPSFGKTKKVLRVFFFFLFGQESKVSWRTLWTDVLSVWHGQANRVSMMTWAGVAPSEQGLSQIVYTVDPSHCVHLAGSFLKTFLNQNAYLANSVLNITWLGAKVCTSWWPQADDQKPNSLIDPLTF